MDQKGIFTIEDRCKQAKEFNNDLQIREASRYVELLYKLEVITQEKREELHKLLET